MLKRLWTRYNFPFSKRKLISLILDIQQILSWQLSGFSYLFCSAYQQKGKLMSSNVPVASSPSLTYWLTSSIGKIMWAERSRTSFYNLFPYRSSKAESSVNKASSSMRLNSQTPAHHWLWFLMWLWNKLFQFCGS